MSGWRNRAGESRVRKSVSSNSRKRPRAEKWTCEYLEVRRLFATVSWITQGNGNWSTGSNWSTGAPPQPGDNVVINVPGLNIVVTYDNSATLQLNNLLNDEELLLSGSGGATWTSGTFDGSGIVQNTTQLSISGSADKILKDGITLNNAPGARITVSGSGNIVGQVGATINNLTDLISGPAMFIVQSDMEITFPTGIGDGNFNNYGTFIKTAGGTAPGNMTEIGGAQGFTFNNNGDCQIRQGTLGLGDNVNASLSSAGTFEISAGATLQYLRGVENIVDVPTGGSPPYIFPAITGAGTLLMTGGNVQHYGVFNVNTVDVESGSLLLQQNMTPVAGTPQQITDITTVPITPACPAGNVTHLILNGGTIGGNGGGIFSLGATTAFNSLPGPMNMPPAGPVSTSTAQPVFALPTGTYELPALIVNNTFSWTGGTMSGTGRMVIDTPAANLTDATITTTNPKTIAGGFGLDIYPEVVWTGSGTIGITGGSALWIHPSGTFWDQNNGTISGQGSTGNLINSGNLLKQNGTGTTLIDTGINFINYNASLGVGGIPLPLYTFSTSPLVAQLDVQTGTVAFNGNSSNTDDYTIAPGAILSFISGTHQNGTNFDLNNTAKILGTNFQGTINFGDAATFTGDNEARLDVGTTNFGGGTYDFNNLAGGAQVIHAGSFTGNSTGSIGGSGTLEIAGTFLWNSGTFNGTGSGSSSLLIDATAVVTLAAGNYTTTNSYSVDNRGTLQWATSPGTLTIAGNFDQTSTGAFDTSIVAGVPDALSVSGTVTIAGALNLSVTSLTPFGGEQYTLIDNTGSAAIAGRFVGYPEGLVFTIGSDTFKLSYVGGTGNDLVLTSIVFPTITITTPTVFLRALTGTTLMTFTVTLSAVTNNNVTVNYTTIPGTAVAGVDYTTTTGTLTIPAGQTTGTILVPIIGTAAVRTAVTFTLALSNPTFSTLGTPSSAVGTIAAINGPPALSFYTTAYVVDENAGFATIIVSTSNSNISSTVNYSTVDGTALAGIDYTATSGLLTFAVGVSRLTFNVPIIDEHLTTGQKFFTINLFNPVGQGATLGAATATVGILDNDGPTPTLSINSVTVSELVYGQTNAVFTVSLSAVSTSVVSVQYSTAPGTALEGKFVPESGTIVLQPGQTSAQIDVPVNSDFVQNSTETFSVNLSNPVNVALGTATGIGTILSQTLSTVPISAGHAFRYLDADGFRTTISLSGPGTGTVYFLGVTTEDGKQIVVNGTTAQSQLSIVTNRGPAAVVNIIVNGSLRSINAPVLSVIGNVTVSGGVQRLRLGTLLGGNSVTIGSDPSISFMNTVVTAVTNATLNSATPLGVLRVGSWQNTPGVTGIIAPGARVISASHNFAGNIFLTGNLGTMVVGGNLNASDIQVTGSINNFVAGTISNSEIFAGVANGVVTLPASNLQFGNTSATLNRLTVAHRTVGAFANTLIAAPTIGNVQLNSVAVGNNGTPFGVAGTSIRLVQGRGTRPIKLTDAALVATPFSDTNLVIHLTT